MSTIKYGYTIKTNLTFNKAVQKTKECLAIEGFGVLTEIDVKQTLKKKLDVDYNNYIILGACNPSFAYEALQAEKEIGLLLPCNIIVYSDNNQIFISVIMPTVAMNMVNNNKLKKIAGTVEKKLKKVVNMLADNTPIQST